MYYFFYYAASSIGPMSVGFITGITGMEYMMLNALAFLLVGFLILMFVKKNPAEI